MSNAIPNRSGQNQGTGDARELFKIQFLTEVLQAFYTVNVTSGRFMERTITEGKGASFPVVGLAGGGVHVPGAEILGRKIKHTEKIINLDDTLISDVFVAKVDELMNHYDVRAPYSRAMGEFLAKVDDYHKFLTLVKAARAPANIPGSTKSGNRIVEAALKTDASKLAASLFGARTIFDENGIPQADTWAFLRPAQVALLVQNKEAIDETYGGVGSYADGDIFGVGGVPIVKTAHLPVADFSDANTDLADLVEATFGESTEVDVLPSKYRFDASTTAGLVAHMGAIGTVKMQGMNLDIDWDPRRRGTLMVATQLKGNDYLRPECVVELATANLT